MPTTCLRFANIGHDGRIETGGGYRSNRHSIDRLRVPSRIGRDDDTFYIRSTTICCSARGK